MRLWVLTLAVLLLAWGILPSEGSTTPSKPALTPESPQASPLYTEAEAIAAIKAGVQAALDVAIPLAVQAALAEEIPKRERAEAERDEAIAVLGPMRLALGKSQGQVERLTIETKWAWAIAGIGGGLAVFAGMTLLLGR